MRYIVIFDLGGGTFDVTVLCVEDGNNEVRSTSGDTHLGGSDIDNILLKHCIEVFKKETQIDISKDDQALNRLRQSCEKAKRLLSSMTEVTISIIALSQKKDFEHKITRAFFEELCQPVFDRLLPQVIKALEEAKIEKTAVNEIVMVGGSTYIPKVREILQEYFEKPLNH